MEIIVIFSAMYFLSYVMFFKRKYLAMWAVKSTDERWYKKEMEKPLFHEEAMLGGVILSGFPTLAILAKIIFF